MIQDIAPYQYRNEYKPLPADENSIAFYFNEQSVLVKKRPEGIQYPRFKDLAALNEKIYEDSIYLFSIDEERYYLVDDISLERLSLFQMENTEMFRGANPQYLAFAGITAYQLYNWYQKNKYCGQCGSAMGHDEKERMVRCSRCKNIVYPKISPAVIIGVTHGNQLLLTQYRHRLAKHYALIAGFVEIGESLEACVQREVMEEVGLKVNNIRYYKSQPWSFSDTLLMGFFCDLAVDEPIRLDEEELSLAQWFEREEIPVEATRDSLTNEMIMHFKNGEL